MPSPGRNSNASEADVVFNECTGNRQLCSQTELVSSNSESRDAIRGNNPCLSRTWRQVNRDFAGPIVARLVTNVQIAELNAVAALLKELYWTSEHIATVRQRSDCLHFQFTKHFNTFQFHVPCKSSFRSSAVTHFNNRRPTFRVQLDTDYCKTQTTEQRREL
jgi:hypothetical protein